VFEIWIISLLHVPPGLYLSADEQTRAAQFHFAPDRLRYERSHSALRMILGMVLDVDPLALRFGVHPRGKPYSLNADIHFNLSHAGDLAVCAIADRPLGVDVEPVRPIPDWRDIASMVFSRQERHALELSAADQRDALFFSLWTRKEALAKASGEGISDNLSVFSVPTVLTTDVQHLTTLPLPNTRRIYSLCTFTPIAGYFGAAAIEIDLPILPTIHTFEG